MIVFESGMMNRTIIIFILSVLTLTGCRNTQSGQDNLFTLVKIRGLCENPDIVATGKLFGSSYDNLILGKDSSIFVYQVVRDSALLTFSNTFDKEIHNICLADADNDGRNDIVLLNGWSGYKDDYVSVHLLSYQNGHWIMKELWSKPSSRPQPVYLKVCDFDGDGRNEIIASCFESKYMVQTIVLSENSGEWVTKASFTERMAMARDIGYLNGGEPLQVVGRVYGDTIGANGDAYIIKGGQKIDLGVFRGVRSAIRIGDGNNDGTNQIYVGDGWHQNYGKIARARLAVITPEGEGFNYALIEDIKGQTSVTQIEIADIAGNTKNEVIVSGDQTIRIYSNDGGQWKAFSDTSLKSGQFVVGNITGNRKKELVIVGKNFKADKGLQVLTFNDLPFDSNLGKEVITELIHPDSLTGKPAPNLLMMKWINWDTQITVPETGKVTLLDFWATWCGPCKKMFPALKLLQDKFRDQDFTIIGLTRLDGRQTVESITEFAVNEQFNYPVGISEEAFNDLLYGVGSIPHIVLIDRNGIVRKTIIGVHDAGFVEEEILKLLNE